MGLHGLLFGDAEVSAHLSDHARLQAMLEVEAALAEAQAALGVVPEACVAPIRAAARAELYDHAALAEEASRAGNLAIPLVRHLTHRVAQTDEAASRYVHWGATSQDVIDTGLVLQLRDAVPLILASLARAAKAAAVHTRRHAHAVMSGRTWLQQAAPTTFGLKAAGWLDALERARARIEAALDSALVLQLGGASGTLAALGPRGVAVSEALAERLGLTLPDTPWHAHRDRLAHLGCALGVAAGTLGKIAGDLALLAQTEVGEAHERATEGGGSSTMPHKRNPVRAAVVLAAAERAPGLVATLLGALRQEHERGLGGWQAEWETLPALVSIVAGAARASAEALETLVVDEARMRSNLQATGGLALSEAVVMALAPQVGKGEAHMMVEAACRRALAEGRPLAEILAAEPAIADRLDSGRIARCLSPDAYLGSAGEYIARVLARNDGEDDA